MTYAKWSIHSNEDRTERLAKLKAREKKLRDEMSDEMWELIKEISRLEHAA